MTDQDFKEENTLIPIHKIDQYMSKIYLTNEEKIRYADACIKCDDEDLVIFAKQVKLSRFIQRKLN